MRQIITILAILTLTIAKGQIDTLHYKTNPSYPCYPGYYVNGKKVSLKTYTKARKETDSLNDIFKKSTFDHPVWIKRYNSNGVLGLLALECGECSVQIGDIPIGLFITFYDNGKIKSKANYALITDIKEMKKRKKKGLMNWCSVENGEFSSYDEKGELKQIMYFEMGKFIKCEYYAGGKLVDTNYGQ